MQLVKGGCSGNFSSFLYKEKKNTQLPRAPEVAWLGSTLGSLSSVLSGDEHDQEPPNPTPESHFRGLICASYFGFLFFTLQLQLPFPIQCLSFSLGTDGYPISICQMNECSHHQSQSQFLLHNLQSPGQNETSVWGSFFKEPGQRVIKGLKTESLLCLPCHHSQLVTHGAF